MITLFECWNGATVQWDRVNPPQIVFAIPPQSPGMVRFFQLSGRICEVQTQADWILNMAGQLFDIPNLPSREINDLVLNMRNETGYAPVTVPYQLGDPFTGYITIPLILWANVRTGRADMYSSLSGLIRGQQLLHPEAPLGPDMRRTSADGLGVNTNQGGTPWGDDGQRFLHSLATMANDSSEINAFLSSGGPGIDYTGTDPTYSYDAQTQFEEDSAGWPGGAYENPDSNYYSPDDNVDYGTTYDYNDY